MISNSLELCSTYILVTFLLFDRLGFAPFTLLDSLYIFYFVDEGLDIFHWQLSLWRCAYPRPSCLSGIFLVTSSHRHSINKLEIGQSSSPIPHSFSHKSSLEIVQCRPWIRVSSSFMSIESSFSWKMWFFRHFIVNSENVLNRSECKRVDHFYMSR